MRPIRWKRARVPGLVAAGILSCLVVLPLVAGQANPTSALQLKDLPTKKVMVDGSSLFQGFNVTLTLTQLVCPTTQSFPVTLTAMVEKPTNRSFNLSFASPTLNFVVPSGEYLSRSYSATLPASVYVVGTNLPVGESPATVHLTAGFAGGNQQCQGAAPAPSAQQMGMFESGFVPKVPPGAIPTPGPEMPLPTTLAIWALVLSALALTRRRSGGST